MDELLHRSRSRQHRLRQGLDIAWAGAGFGLSASLGFLWLCFSIYTPRSRELKTIVYGFSAVLVLVGWVLGQAKGKREGPASEEFRTLTAEITRLTAKKDELGLTILELESAIVAAYATEAAQPAPVQPISPSLNGPFIPHLNRTV